MMRANKLYRVKNNQRARSGFGLKTAQKAGEQCTITWKVNNPNGKYAISASSAACTAAACNFGCGLSDCWEE